MNRQIWIEVDADLEKVAEFLKRGSAAFEVHFGKRYPNFSHGFDRLTAMLDEWAKQNQRKIRITVYRPDGTTVARILGAVGAGALVGLVGEGLLLGEWFGPLGIAVGALAGLSIGLALTRVVDIEVSIFLPGGSPDPVLC